MKKFYAALAIALGFGLAATAQVQNRALQLTPTATVDCGQMPQLAGLSSYTIQWWMCPATWRQGSTMLAGNGFTARLGQAGTVEVSVGTGRLTATDATRLAAGRWAQITLIVKNGAARLLVGDVQKTSGQLPALTEADTAFTMGGGYEGRLDEVRLWKCALTDDFEHFAFTTLTRWVPQYDDLVAYYKMDQDQCANLVDYKNIDTVEPYNNHGILSSGATRVSAADNTQMPYLINSAYTATERFFDRVCPPDQYLLANDIIMLGMHSDGTGNVLYDSPCNHGKNRGGQYLAEYEGRQGVLAFDGNAHFEGTARTIYNHTQWSFELWVYIDEWTDGAYLLRKETADAAQGVSLRLGTTAGIDETPERALILRINGKLWRFPNSKSTLETGKWQHIAVQPTGTATTALKAVNMYVNGKTFSVRAKYMDADALTTDIGDTGDAPCTLGEGFKGKMDDVCVWQTANSNLPHYSKEVPMPDVNRPTGSDLMQCCDTYYRFDRPDNLGWDYHSQDEWLRQIKAVYDGYRGAKFYISARQPQDRGLDACLQDATWRDTFARNLAARCAGYDGVELDLEWTYSQWGNYSKMATLIRQYLDQMYPGEDKAFRISCHNVCHNYPTNNMGCVTGFTFQQYGPETSSFEYNNFTSNVQGFINYGFPREKIITSYSTTTSGNPTKGVKDYFTAGDNEANYTPTNNNAESLTFPDGTSVRVCGPMQVYKRAKYTREQGLMGIFYWDMGNDSWNTGDDGRPVMNKWNFAKWCSYGLAPNVDRDVREVVVNHYGTDTGIESVTHMAAPYAGATYNLKGQRVGKNYRGLVIKNGRTTLVR